MIDFVAIDFETANSKRTSACSIGLTFVENGKIISTEHYLIKPRPNYFDSFNTKIHRITPKDVKNSPRFNELWEELSPRLLGKTIVAHNASFDMSVLRATLSAYKIEYPELKYACTYLLSKHLYPELINYQLPTVCKHVEYDFSNHHNAEADSLASANVFLKILEHTNCTAIYHLSERLPIRMGQLYHDGSYQPFSVITKKHKTELFNITPSVPIDGINVDNPFYGKNVLFTGKLESMTREEAWQIIVDNGGNPLKSFSSKIDFLICGVSKLTTEFLTTAKLQKTMDLKRNGVPIEILTEQDFINFMKTESLTYELTIDTIKSHEDSFIQRNMYNDFCNKRILFSEDISNTHNWQLTGNCGGRCCWEIDDIFDSDYFVISNKDMANLEKGVKSNSVIKFEDAVRGKGKQGKLKNIIVMSEDCFLNYLERRRIFETDRCTMNVHPFEITSGCNRDGITISVNFDKLNSNN